jgi:uncharacterized membrane protein
MDHVIERPIGATAMPEVRSVETSRPVEWLRLGFKDLTTARAPSIGIGVFVAGFGVLLLTLAWGASYLVPALIGGFLLVAPFAAIALYAMSEQLEAKRPVDLTRALFAWRRNTGSIALFGLMLTLSLILWERIAAIVFALSYGGTVPDLSAVMRDVLFSGNYVALTLAFLGSGALFAAMVFTLSVVTAPLLLDRPVDVITATLTSMRCCLHNPGAMLLWAVLIAGLTVIGFATLMVGLIVIFPWLGHATWHAYRDLVA